MEINYYIKTETTSGGPFSVDTLCHMVLTRRLLPSDRVSTNKHDWKRADQVVELANLFPNKNIMAVLAFCFGSLGGHWFYAGRNGLGILYLTLHFVLTIGSFGLLFWVMPLVGVIEAFLIWTRQ